MWFPVFLTAEDRKRNIGVAEGEEETDFDIVRFVR